MGYLIVVGKTNKTDYPNYQASWEKTEKEAIKEGKRLLKKKLESGEYAGEIPTEVIIAKEIKKINKMM